MSQTILVTGATGTQGGGLVKALLKNNPGTTIHALVRNPDSEASQALVKLSSHVKIFKGDFDNVASIKAAASDCTAAFLNVSPVFTGDTGEAEHAQNLVTACAAVPSLKRIVYSSSSVMDHPLDSKMWTEYVPNNPKAWMTSYLISKKECEDIITGSSASDFPDGWCILRGTTFFTNFLQPFTKFMYSDLEVNQTITSGIDPKLQVPYIDPNDISVLSANILLSDPGQWNSQYKGKAMLMATEQLTLRQIVDGMNKALKSAGSEKQVKLNHVPADEARQRAEAGDPFMSAQLFQNSYEGDYDLGKIKGFGIDVEQMVGVDEFFEREKEQVVAAVGGR